MGKPNHATRSLKYFPPIRQIACSKDSRRITYPLHGSHPKLCPGLGDDMTDNQARILNDLLKANFLPNTEEELVHCRELVTTYRRMEEKIIAPRLAPGVLDGEPFDQALLKEVITKTVYKVPRRFLEAIDDTPYPGQHRQARVRQRSFCDDNPFTTRVIVNRRRHHLFGNGLVRTTDNLGNLENSLHIPNFRLFVAKVSRGAMVDQGNDQVSGQQRSISCLFEPFAKSYQIDPQNFCFHMPICGDLR